VASNAKNYSTGAFEEKLRKELFKKTKNNRYLKVISVLQYVEKKKYDMVLGFLCLDNYLPLFA